jgi:predicted dehydrogenase
VIKTAIIGCGKIADEHASLLARHSDCKIVGVCDKEDLMAKQLSERYNVGRYFTDIRTMLEAVRPDVVHITTPPQTHFSLGALCLKAGVHLLIEKPFTVSEQEASELVELALRMKKKITVGHNIQFNHESVEMRELIRGGFLGGPPIHMESYYTYGFQELYGQAFLGDENHWVRALPGKLLHNVISHGICKIAEYITDPSPIIKTVGYTSPYLLNIGQDGIVDELRVIVHSISQNTSAYFTFSSQVSPRLFQFRIYGPENSLILDHNLRILIKLRKSDSLKSYLNHFIAPRRLAKQYLSNSRRNIVRFIKKDFHMDHGRRLLVQQFYKAIKEDGPEPISHREIILTARIMDTIFNQLNEEFHISK